LKPITFGNIQNKL